jgi:nitrite reductase/ring-hydroxylating ferredoxin subunit
MNARLSRGNINQNIVTCLLHAAKFDVTSGKNITEPVMEPPSGIGTIASQMAKIYGICWPRGAVH